MKTIWLASGAYLLFAAGAATAAPVIDNEHVTVWDAPLAAGQAAPETPADLESVTMFLEGGTVSTRHADGSVTTATHQFGDAVFNPRGAKNADTAVNGPVHEVIVAMKDAPPPAANPTPAGMMSSFPRPGAEKTLEGTRFNVWRFSWIPNTPVVMHHHDKDLVMVFRFDGRLRSTTPDGKATDIPFKQAQITYSKAGNTHTETLIDDRQSAVDFELK
jgi:hypothetical protein